VLYFLPGEEKRSLYVVCKSWRELMMMELDTRGLGLKWFTDNNKQLGQILDNFNRLYSLGLN